MDIQKKYSWINDIDYSKYLDEDSKLIVQEFGIEIYLKLFTIFGKTRIAFNDKFFYACKKEFIKKHSSDYTLKQFSLMLKVSEEFVRKAIKN